MDWICSHLLPPWLKSGYACMTKKTLTDHFSLLQIWSYFHSLGHCLYQIWKRCAHHSKCWKCYGEEQSFNKWAVRASNNKIQVVINRDYPLSLEKDRGHSLENVRRTHCQWLFVHTWTIESRDTDRKHQIQKAFRIELVTLRLHGLCLNHHTRTGWFFLLVVRKRNWVKNAFHIVASFHCTLRLCL